MSVKYTKKKQKDKYSGQGILEFRSGSASHVELSRNAGEVAVITGGVLTAVLSTLLSLCPWSGECQHLTRDT